MASNTLPRPPRETANPSPPRPASSVRRTSSIDVCWPDGVTGNRKFIGTARDYRTDASGEVGETLGEARFEARIDDEKQILSISANPAPPQIGELVGQRAGNHLRMMLRETMPELLERGDPLYLPLDDLSGTALVSAFGFSQWDPEYGKKFRERLSDEQFMALMEQRTNVCWGLAEGNSGLDPHDVDDVAGADAGELRNAADPEGWHDLPDEDGPGFRRARRIDVWREGDGLLRVHSSFQDSAKRRDQGRCAIHEYDLDLTIDEASREILSLTATPRILPFPECPGAIHNAQRMVGKPIDAIRDEVLAHLRKTEGCTHLNDALRALAEVPKLAAYL
ncbi:MAG: DUF2889 domain-containing protein [Sphingomonadaceae bacterium]